MHEGEAGIDAISAQFAGTDLAGDAPAGPTPLA